MEKINEHLGTIFSLCMYFLLVNMYALYLQLELRIQAKPCPIWKLQIRLKSPNKNILKLHV